MNIQKPQDINQSNKQQRLDYINCAANEDYNGMANIIYNSDGTEKEELIGKCVVKDLYNSFISGFMQEENYNQSEILDTLANHLSDYNVSINNIQVIGEYDSSFQYHVNNVLYYNGDAYFTIVTPPVGTIPTNTSYFIKLGLRGDKGITSLGINKYDIWNSNTAYEQYCIVQYNNILYVSKTSNKGKVPSNNPNDWEKAVDFNKSIAWLNTTKPDYTMGGSLWMEII